MLICLIFVVLIDMCIISLNLNINFCFDYLNKGLCIKFGNIWNNVLYKNKFLLNIIFFLLIDVYMDKDIK